MKVNKLICFLALIFFCYSFSAAQITEETAQREISAKRFRQAREIYQKLAALQPENLSYKIWSARLSGWLSELPRALKEYNEVLQINPKNNEALLGKAYVLMWQKKYGKSKEILAVAEKNGRYDAAFLVAKINYFRYQNKLKEAREVVKTAKEVVAENVEITELEQLLEKAKATTIQAGCEQNFEPFTATTTSCFASVTTQKGNNRITAKLQTGNRFGKLYREVGANFKHDVNSKLTILANSSIELKKTVNADTNIGFNYMPNNRLNVGADYRYWRLNGKNIHILSSNTSFKLNEKTSVQTTVYNSSNNVILIRFNRQLTKSFNTNLNYVKAFEKIKPNSFNLSQNAIVLNGKYQVSKSILISGSFGYSKKDKTPTKQIFGFGFTLSK